MKVFFINTELVVESTPEIFTPTADNMFDDKYVDRGSCTVGQPITMGTMHAFASVRFRILPNKTYKFINIGNCDTMYADKAVYADINGNFIASFDDAVMTFTVPDNPSIAYIYLSNGGLFPDADNKQLELSKMEPVIE